MIPAELTDLRYNQENTESITDHLWVVDYSRPILCCLSELGPVLYINARPNKRPSFQNKMMYITETTLTL